MRCRRLDASPQPPDKTRPDISQWRPAVSAHATSAAAAAGVMPRGRMASFLGLFIVPGIAQSVLLTVIPLEALRLLGTARAVTLLYVAAGLAAVIGRLSIPLLVQLIQRRLVFSLGASLLAISDALFGDPQPDGIWLRTRTQQLRVCLHRGHQQSLLARPHPTPRPPALRTDTHFCLRRTLDLGSVVWSVSSAAHLFCSAFRRRGYRCDRTPGALLVATVTEHVPPNRKPPNPMRYLPRFFSQPRLRLAWCLAGARSAWWNTFYVYTPIFAVTSGLTAETGGAILRSAPVGYFWCHCGAGSGAVMDYGVCWPSAMRLQG